MRYRERTSSLRAGLDKERERGHTPEHSNHDICVEERNQPVDSWRDDGRQPSWQ
jgi:hypothetical protein